MPFAVVETTNARGCKELSVVPDKWLRSSKRGSIVLWPNARKTAEQEKLLRDANSHPKKSWLKFKCTVKRSSISSFAAATRLLDELSGESSTDVSQLIRRKAKQNRRTSANFQQMLVLEGTPNTSPTPVIMEVRGNIRDKIPLQVTSPPSPARTTVIAAKVEGNVHTGPTPTQPAVIADISEDNVQTVEYVTYETIQEPDTLMETDNSTQDLLREIIGMQHQINQRLDRLEKRTANICTQSEFILDSIRKFSSRVTSIEDPPSFYFNPIENEQQLADLESKLADKDFKSKMVNK